MSNITRLAVLASAGVFAMDVHAAPTTVRLTENGSPVATIVIAESASKAARFAALELQAHVRLISGAELRIATDDAEIAGPRVLAGASSATTAMGLANDSLDHQEYLIRFAPDTIVLMGRDKIDTSPLEYDFLAKSNAVRTWPSFWDEQGTMYAVYDFLERFCGVRWFNPTDVGTVCEPRKTLAVTGDDIRRKPGMRYRGGRAAFRLAEKHQAGGGLWRSGTDEAQAYDDAAYPRIKAKYTHPHHVQSAVRAQNTLFMFRMRAGGEKALCNHSFYDFYERFLLKDHKNFVSYHPEYFAKGYDGDELPQLCYSNEATIEQVVCDARNYFDNGGHQRAMRMVSGPGYTWGKNFYALEPMDNSAYCRCETCTPQYEPRRGRHSTHSTHWFRFVNRVADELRKSHPDKMISTLAYGSHEGLPTGLHVADNVAVHFCISSNRNCGSARAHLDAQLARLQEWRDRESVPMYLWHYHCFPKEIADNGKFHCFPGFFAHELKKQFDYYRGVGIRGIFHCGFDGEVECYVTYKLMDDPTLDVNWLLDDYFTRFYGPAGEALKKWYLLAEQRYCDPVNYPIQANGERYNGHQNVSVAWLHLGNAETMERLDSYMHEAQRVAKGVYATRVDLWDKGVWSYMKAGRDSYVERMSSSIPSTVAKRVPSAGGDATGVDWSKAGEVGGSWYLRGGADPSRRVFGGRVCHDGEYLYLELTEKDATDEQLVTSAQVFCFDCWEILFARQRAQPFRQYAVGPTGMTRALSYGEVNWRQGVPMDETGIRAWGDTPGAGWVARLSWPLRSIVDEPVGSGDTLYMNVLRVSNPKLAAEPRFGIDTWVSYCTVKEVDRLGEVRLE